MNLTGRLLVLTYTRMKSFLSYLWRDKLSFLRSTRFQKLVIIGVLEALVAVEVIDGAYIEVFVHFFDLVLGGSVAIRTVDRFGEKTGGA